MFSAYSPIEETEYISRQPWEEKYSSMTHYKLYYFDARGRAEYVRLIFALAGVEYEDYRIDRADWPELKKKMPVGQVPVLEVDGKEMIPETYTICRYLARNFGLHGADNSDGLRIDMLVDCQEDFNKPLMAIAREQDTEEKERKKAMFMSTQQPVYLQQFQKLLEQNNGGDGWMVGNEISWADLAFLHGLSWPIVFGMSTPWDEYPKLKALKERVESHPKVRAWLETRPVTAW